MRALLVYLLFVASIATTRAGSPTADANALARFCVAGQTNFGSILANWCTVASVCSWQGVTCDATQCVTDLELTNPALTGTFPATGVTLGSLRTLRIVDVQLDGVLPQSLFTAAAASLERLELQKTGDLVFDVQHLRLLTSATHILARSFNGAGGVLDFPLSVSLEQLVLEFGGLSVVSDDFFDLQIQLANSLTQLSLRGNQFNGDVPSSLCSMFSLREIDLSYNRFSSQDVCTVLMNPDTLVSCDYRHNAFCTIDETVGAFAVRDSTICLLDSKPRATLDPCGVCGGASECVDCAGIADGSSVADACGVCEGDDSTCQDCLGVTLGTATFDDCGECNGDNACLDCSGVPFGTLELSPCGVCNGPEEECTDCTGTLLGTAVYDACDVCDGTGATCADCFGVPNGLAVLDLCGQCGGNSSECTDCRGVLDGSYVLDCCGVCGGDNSTCGVEFIRNSDGGEHFRIWAIVGVFIFVALVTCCAYVCGAVSRDHPSQQQRSRRRTRQERQADNCETSLLPSVTIESDDDYQY